MKKSIPKREFNHLFSLIRFDGGAWIIANFDSREGTAIFLLLLVTTNDLQYDIYSLAEKVIYEKLNEFIALIRNKSGEKRKVIRINNREEFTSDENENFLRANEIKHQYTVP